MRAFIRRHERLHKVVHATYCRAVGPFDRRRAISSSGIQPPPGLSLSVSASPNPANVGQTIAFTESASGGTPPYTYTWDYGDGSGTGDGSSTDHSYSESGAFTFTGTVQDAAFNVATAQGIENVNQTAFTVIGSANPDQGYYPPNFTTQFTATAYGTSGLVGWEWDFGDGDQAFVQNPQHTYTAPYFYIVTVTGYVAQTGQKTQFVFPVIVLPAI